MKDWVPVFTVGLGLAGLMLALHTQTQNQFADVRSDIEQLDNRFTSRIEALDDRLTSRIEALDDRLTSRIEALDGRVYELNERLTRVETRIIEAVLP